MKILHCVPNYHPSKGGNQFLIQRVSEEIVAQFNDEVTVLTTDLLFGPHIRDNVKLSPNKVKLNDVEILRFKRVTLHLTWIRVIKKVFIKAGFPLSGNLNILTNGPISLGMFFRMLLGKEQVIAGTSSNFAHLLFPLLPRFVKGKKKFIYHGALHIEDPENFQIPSWVFRSIMRSDAYIANTPFEAQFLIERGIPESKIFPIGCGVDLQSRCEHKIQEFKKRYELSNKKIISYVGRLAPFKGVDKLILAMSIVWDKHPDTELVIAGADSTYVSILRDIINQLDSKSKNKINLILDFEEQDKSTIFQLSDVLVNVSNSESFGIVFVEAWGAKTPVIGSNIPAVESLIDNKVDGFTVDHNDYKDLANKIIYYLGQEQSRKEMGEKGYLKVKEKYTWLKVAQKYREVYEKVLTE